MTGYAFLTLKTGNSNSYTFLVVPSITNLSSKNALFHWFQWNSTFFSFWLIIEGATGKALQFIMQLKSIYNKNIAFIEQKMLFWTLQRGSNKKKSINWHYFGQEFFLYWPLQSCLQRLVLVLQKDALFHWEIKTLSTKFHFQFWLGWCFLINNLMIIYNNITNWYDNLPIEYSLFRLALFQASAWNPLYQKTKNISTTPIDIRKYIDCSLVRPACLV